MKRELKIGIFFTGALLVLADLHLHRRRPGSNLFQPAGLHRSTSATTPSLGLDKTAAVKMAGIKIGYVKDILLEPEAGPKVVMNIYPQFKVPQGAPRRSLSVPRAARENGSWTSSPERVRRPTSCPVRRSEGLPAVRLRPDGVRCFVSIGDEIKQVERVPARTSLGKETRARTSGRPSRTFPPWRPSSSGFVAQNKGSLGQTLTAASSTGRHGHRPALSRDRGQPQQNGDPNGIPGR